MPRETEWFILLRNIAKVRILVLKLCFFSDDFVLIPVCVKERQSQILSSSVIAQSLASAKLAIQGVITRLKVYYKFVKYI